MRMDHKRVDHTGLKTTVDDPQLKNITLKIQSTTQGETKLSLLIPSHFFKTMKRLTFQQQSMLTVCIRDIS
jgi:hypothetical protein